MRFFMVSDAVTVQIVYLRRKITAYHEKPTVSHITCPGIGVRGTDMDGTVKLDTLFE